MKNKDFVPFSTWLLNNIQKCHINKTKLAEMCHMTPRTVYNHCRGIEPKFTDVVVYCWAFSKLTRTFLFYDPEAVYEDVLKEFDNY